MTDCELNARRAKVAVTAFWISSMRADETSRGSHALIRDPLAEALTGVGGRRIFDAFKAEYSGAASEARSYAHLSLAALGVLGAGIVRGRPVHAIRAASLCMWRSLRGTELSRIHNDHVRRTLYIDRACERAAARGVRQLVTIGAGLDTRPYRLFANAPDLAAFEVDHPDLFAYKEQALARVGASPVCKRTIVPLEYDEVATWPERAAKVGFEPRMPAIFVLEGVLMYLPEATQLELLRAISAAAAHGSVLAGDIFQFPRKRLSMPVGDLAFDLHATDPDWLQATLAELGCAPIELAECRSDSVARALGESVPLMPFLPRKLWSYQRYFFTATKS
jgi:methyltransferase (TIGR00027 family)